MSRISTKWSWLTSTAQLNAQAFAIQMTIAALQDLLKEDSKLIYSYELEEVESPAGEVHMRFKGRLHRDEPFTCTCILGLFDGFLPIGVHLTLPDRGRVLVASCRIVQAGHGGTRMLIAAGGQDLVEQSRDLGEAFAHRAIFPQP